MITGEKKKQFLAIKSMFLSGSVSRMKDIESLYPTGISKALGMNHSRYIQKLYKPEDFKFKHIHDLSKLLNVEIQIIVDVIIKELNSPAKASKRKL